MRKNVSVRMVCIFFVHLLTFNSNSTGITVDNYVFEEKQTQDAAKRLWNK